MKKFSSISLLTAMAASGLALGAPAYTTPVGYVTKTLAPNQFNLVGLTLQNPTLVAGILDAASSNSVTDTQSNFSTLLTAGKIYILELEDGTIQEIATWSASVLNTPDNISTKVTGGTTSFKIREAATISSIFGAANKFGLGVDTDGSFTGTDFIQIPNSSGSFDSVYYFNDGETTGWFDNIGNPADNKAIVYADGIFIKRSSGSSINLIVSGEVKLAKTAGVLNSGFNYLGAVAPAGVTLATSGLKNYLAFDSTGDIETADLIQIQQNNGTYISAYYFNDGETVGWFTATGEPADNISLDGGFLLRNRTGAKPYVINAPTL